MYRDIYTWYKTKQNKKVSAVSRLNRCSGWRPLQRSSCLTTDCLRCCCDGCDIVFSYRTGQGRQGLPPWDGNGQPTMAGGDGASSGSGAVGGGALGEVKVRALRLWFMFALPWLFPWNRSALSVSWAGTMKTLFLLLFLFFCC